MVQQNELFSTFYRQLTGIYHRIHNKNIFLNMVVESLQSIIRKIPLGETNWEIDAGNFPLSILAVRFLSGRFPPLLFLVSAFLYVKFS